MPKYTFNGVTVTATARRSSTRDDKKYVRTVTYQGKTRLVHYGDPKLPMRRNNDQARANFVARHNCGSKKDPFAPGFWACLDWQRPSEGRETVKIDTEKAKKLQRLLEAGARNSRVDYGRIQEIHDTACALGAKCGQENVPGVLSSMSENHDMAVELLLQQGYTIEEARKIAEFTFSKKKLS